MASETENVPEAQVPSKGLRAVYRAVTAFTGPLTRRNLLTWSVLIVGVLTIRWLVFENYSVPTGSMEPTLHGDPRLLRGDHVTVNKMVYGPRWPFTKKRISHWSEPQRWDIVVFKAVDPKSEHGTLIKRIVGLPGERIHIQDGKIQVNGTTIEPPEALRKVLYYTSGFTALEKDVRRLAAVMAKREMRPVVLNPANFTVRDLYAQLDEVRATLGGRDPATMEQSEIDDATRGMSKVSLDIVAKLLEAEQEVQYPLRYGILPDDQYAVVPPDCYLVLGDNSGDSADGRYFGWLPNGNILGRASCIWWPVTRWRDFTGFSQTWWGRGLLYGIPTLLILFELNAWRRRRAARRLAAAS